MTRAEFAQIAVVLDHCWPGDFTETMEAAYFCVLQDKSAASIEQACRNLVNKGARFRPTPAELVRSAGAVANRRESIALQKQAFALKHGTEMAAEFFPETLFQRPALDA